MVFSSVVFIYYFLPCFLCVYFLSPNFLKNKTALIASLFFYAWGAPTLVPLVITLSFVDFWVAHKITDRPEHPRPNYYYLGAVLLNLASLFYFKYANFFIEEFGNLLSIDFEWQKIILPIGISFYTFQKISFLIDVKRNRAAAPKKFSDYLLFVLCFPQLIAGPIVRFETVALQLNSRIHSIAKVSEGLSRFSIGLAKKILLANPMGNVADTIFALPGNSLPAGFAWIGILAYAMQIYFDFSGYSDMAIGLGRVMGFDFPENFNRPYRASSITDFWRRWHITLSSWMKEYLYIPLGGNRGSKLRTY
ncbi:UNVERIFIED_CONTAM: hypothetical protein GTU68_015621, partial [Idotea baltica]|nr:hypothetical protein [Idotea baltica]